MGGGGPSSPPPSCSSALHTALAMSRRNVELVRSLIPPPDTDVAGLLRDEVAFEQTKAILEPMIDRAIESVAVWRGGATYSGVEGFREMWLDWLEPWASYRVQVDEVIDAGDLVVVLVRDRGRRDDTDAEVELRSGSVWEVRGGRVVRVQFCANQEEARAVGGLADAQ
jgi:ketosteroid isomerase-like protein